MHRISLRVVDDLAGSLFQIAKKRGISVNALITEIAWDFCNGWAVKAERREQWN